MCRRSCRACARITYASTTPQPALASSAYCIGHAPRRSAYDARTLRCVRATWTRRPSASCTSRAPSWTSHAMRGGGGHDDVVRDDDDVRRSGTRRARYVACGCTRTCPTLARSTSAASLGSLHGGSDVRTPYGVHDVRAQHETCAICACIGPICACHDARRRCSAQTRRASCRTMASRRRSTPQAPNHAWCTPCVGRLGSIEACRCVSVVHRGSASRTGSVAVARDTESEALAR